MHSALTDRRQAFLRPFRTCERSGVGHPFGRGPGAQLSSNCCCLLFHSGSQGCLPFIACTTTTGPSDVCDMSFWTLPSALTKQPAHLTWAITDR